jgi:hypothetical protein
MMTIDEAIAHAEWAANNCEGECAEEHRQLAEWLKELRERKSTDVALEDERNLLSERLGDYREALRYARAENANLRGMVAVLWKCCAWETNVGWCGECDYYDDDNGGCKVKGQIDRLGIEVEE